MTEIEIQALAARIDRDLVETRKLTEEREKLFQESRRLTMEHDRLDAERRKLDRERWLTPLLATVSVLGGLLGLASFLASLLKG